MCFGFGDKVSRSRRLPCTRARLTLEPTRLATLLCASLPFCFFSEKKENLTARRDFNLPPPRLWLKLWVRPPVAARGRGGRPSPPGGLGRPRRQTPRTTRQRPVATDNRGRPARAHGALPAHTTARYPARKLGVRTPRATGALPGARTRTPARVKRHVSAAWNRRPSAACNRRRLALHGACKSTQLASYLDRSISDSGF